MFGFSSIFAALEPMFRRARVSAVSRPASPGQHLFWAFPDVAEVFSLLRSSPAGLTHENVESLHEEYGPNAIPEKNSHSMTASFIEAMFNPFSLILMLLALISLCTDVLFVPAASRDFSGVAIICTMLALSTALRLIQEGRSARAASALRNMVRTSVIVLRDGHEQQVPLEALVPGDLVLLAAGDMIPADLRLTQAKDLFVSQSGLTGETTPVEKFAQLKADDPRPHSPLEASTLVFMGSNVNSGAARGIVIATGKSSLFGHMAQSLNEKRGKTGFDKGINSVSWVFIRFMLCMAPAVLLINGFTKGDWMDACLFALSVAVGITPEILPVIVATNLGKGALALARQKTIVKRLNAMQNFGAMDVLCTDKTGTLTQDQIVLEMHLNVQGEEDDRVLRYAFLNSYFQTGLRNLLDAAILAHADSAGYRTLEERFRKVDEIPFDFTRRRMSVVLADNKGGARMITKGALEEMLAISSHAECAGRVVELTAALRESIMSTAQNLNSQGMRVLGVARKLAATDRTTFEPGDERDMVFMGSLAFLDPPRESAAQAVRAFLDNGVAVKVLTGDNDAVTRNICRRLGIADDTVTTGAQMDAMDDAALSARLHDCAIFAKLAPDHKARLVRLLRGQGHTVGFLGDGINDIAAMHAADVSISVDSAVDIARETADIILLEKDLMVLEHGMLEGRKVFINILKYIKITSSSNFGNMFSVVIASAFLPFLPMLPLQVLLLNLIYEISCMTMPWDNVDGEYTAMPRQWEASSIGRFMRWFGPASSVFDIATFAALYFIICPAVLGGPYASLDPAAQAHFANLFQAGWFVESLWTQTLVIHLLRTGKIPFAQSRMALPVALTTTAMIGFGTTLPFTAVGGMVGFVALPPQFFLWMGSMVVSYALLCQTVKTVYIKKFHEFL